MPTSINGSTGGGASAPAGTGVVTVSSGAFVDPVASAATTRATLDAQQDVFTTRGDLVRAGVSGVAERFAAVTNGHVVGGDGTDVVSRAIATTLAVDAAANRTALGLGDASGLNVGTTSSSVAAGTASDTLITLGGWTDTGRLSRAATAAVDAAGGTGYVWLLVGYLASSTAAQRKIWEYYNTTGWGFLVNGTTLQMIGAGINIGGGGATTPSSIGITLGTAAQFALAVEMTATHIRASLNGAAVVATSYTGTFSPALAASTMGIGGDKAAGAGFGFVEGSLAAYAALNGALGDARLVTLSAAMQTQWDAENALTSGELATLVFSWRASTSPRVRVGYGPMTQNSTQVAVRRK
jgi:hypothetical protein